MVASSQPNSLHHLPHRHLERLASVTSFSRRCKVVGQALGRLPPMWGRCFHTRVIVSAEALFVLAEQISSFVSPSALSGVRA